MLLSVREILLVPVLFMKVNKNQSIKQIVYCLYSIHSRRHPVTNLQLTRKKNQNSKRQETVRHLCTHATPSSLLARYRRTPSPSLSPQPLRLAATYSGSPVPAHRILAKPLLQRPRLAGTTHLAGMLRRCCTTPSFSSSASRLVV